MMALIRNRARSCAAALVIGGGIAALNNPTTLHAIQAAPRALIKFVTAAEGNEARYLVREQLAGRDLENDAIGKTTAVTGTLVLDDKGAIVRDSSKFVVDLASIASDNARRDGYVRRNTFQVEQFPQAVFVPFLFRGLPASLPTSGPVSFEMIGQLTIHGVSRLTTWTVTGQAAADRYTGTAKTQFVFDDFKMTQPKVPVVLSVKDTIRLEYDFNLVRQK